MTFSPTEFANDAPALVEDVLGSRWAPLFKNPCTFGPDVFSKVMMNFIRNPNLNSSWLFRADILLERDPAQEEFRDSSLPEPIMVQFLGFQMDKVIIRKLIPRNTARDNPLDQTCLIYHSSEPGEVTRSLVVYKPHLTSPSDVPFYHPSVQGLAFLHEWNATTEGAISIHYHFLRCFVLINKSINGYLKLYGAYDCKCIVPKIFP